MKRLLFIIPLMFIGVFVNAQILDPVIWEFSQSKITESEVELQFKASIEEHWHLYSQLVKLEGTNATEFIFVNDSRYELIDGVIEGEPIEVFDPIYEMKLKYFENEVIFKQKVKILSSNPFAIKGKIYFITCDESQCFFPDPLTFSFNVNGFIEEEKIIEEITTQDIENTQKYKDELNQLSLEPVSLRAGCSHVYHLYVIGIERRGALVAYLKSRGIIAGIHYPVPVHLMPA